LHNEIITCHTKDFSYFTAPRFINAVVIPAVAAVSVVVVVIVVVAVFVAMEMKPYGKILLYFAIQ
jgi:hypothetical protein